VLCPNATGSFRNSCIGCVTNSSCFMTCQCLTGVDGRTRTASSVDLKLCTIYDNFNGSLRCVFTPSPTFPTERPTRSPTRIGQSHSPTMNPSKSPTQVPSKLPSQLPTRMPSDAPTTVSPTLASSSPSTTTPTALPTTSPTVLCPNATGSFRDSCIGCVTNSSCFMTCNCLSGQVSMNISLAVTRPVVDLKLCNVFNNINGTLACALSRTIGFDPILNPEPFFSAFGPVSYDLFITGISGSPGSSFIVVSAFSDNANLMPDPVVTYNYPASFATLRLTIRANRTGVARLTITAVDSLLQSASRQLSITVYARSKNAPYFEPIANPEAVGENAGLQTIRITGITGGTGPLSILVSSSNPGLTGDIAVVYTFPGSSALLRYRPQADTFGKAVVYVYVVDSKFASSALSFTVEVVAKTSIGGPRLNPIRIPAPIMHSTAVQQQLLIEGISGVGNLTVSAVSSNKTVLADLAVLYMSPSSTAILSYRTIPGKWGLVTVTVKVSDQNSRVASSSVLVRVLGPGMENNCIYSEWSRWGTCSKICNSGIQVRVRALIQQLGSASCINLNETRTCNQAICVAPSFDEIQNVTFSQSSGWHLVDITGIKSNTNSKVVISGVSSNTDLILDPEIVYTWPQSTASVVLYVLPAKYGTASITIVVSELRDGERNQTSRSFVVTVPEHNCTVSWGPWSVCSVSCGGGTMSRSQRALGCHSGLNLQTETKSCNLQDCEVSCTWSPWSACSKPCGGGTMQRSQVPINVELDSVRACPVAVEHSPCNQHACTTVLYSCKNNCGRKTSADFACGCDSSCSTWGDCCSDYLEHCFVSATQHSCVQSCGFPAPSKLCWCDPSCEQNNDCCEDFKSACKAPTFSPTQATKRPTMLPTSSPTSRALPPSPLASLLHTDPTLKTCATRCGTQNRVEVQAEASMIFALDSLSPLFAAPPCQCDSNCANIGDCCSDFESRCNLVPVINGMHGTSCYARCGVARTSSVLLALPLRICHCDATCASYNDCCSDFNELCAQFSQTATLQPVSANSCRNRCTAYDPMHGYGLCYCDSQCYRNHDCCPDRDLVCF